MTFCWAVLKNSSDGSKAIQDAFCALKSVWATVMTARLLLLWLVISCLCQHGHCLYYRVHILLHSCLSCPAWVKTSTEDGRATSSPSHYLYFPLFICCIWHRGDRHLCFTCGLLFKEAKALLCEWFCKKKDYFSSNTVKRLKKFRSRVPNSRGKLQKDLCAFERHTRHQTAVSESIGYHKWPCSGKAN